MLDSDAREFLWTLLQTPGPSGFEAAAARMWRSRASHYGAEVATDVTGNSTAIFNPSGSPTILFVGHLDEIGVIVHHIDDEGYLYLSPIGGWDPQVLVAQRIRFLTSRGDVVGVIGRVPIHLIAPDQRDKGAKLSELWADVGATSRDDAERLVAVGDPGVIETPVLELANDRIASRSVDNRVGAFVVLEAARRYAERPGEVRVVALAATQEEIGHLGGGALVGATKLAPAAAIVVDVTFASDHPRVEKKELGAHVIGGGPVLGRGGILSPTLFSLMESVARERELPYSVQANAGATGTDADAIARSGRGVATGLVSIPNRYMHSPNELVSLRDLAHAITLLADTARAITGATDFVRR
jgi:endoglucanase